MTGERLDVTMARLLILRDTSDEWLIGRAVRLAQVGGNRLLHWVGCLGLPRNGQEFFDISRHDISPNTPRYDDRFRGFTFFLTRASTMEILSRIVVSVEMRADLSRFVFVQIIDTTEGLLDEIWDPLMFSLLSMTLGLSRIYPLPALCIRAFGREYWKEIGEDMRAHVRELEDARDAFERYYYG